MLKRSARIGLEVIAALVAIAVIATGVLAWRASQGPVTLDFLTPRLEAELSGMREGVAVEVGGTVLAWNGWPATFALRLTDLRVTAGEGQTVRVPAVDLRLNLTALLNGTVAPTSITARGARLTIVRAPDGFRFGTPEAAPGPEASDVSTLLPDLLAELMAAPRPDRRLSYLTELRIADAALRLRDDILGVAWHAPAANLALRRTQGGLAGEAEVALALGGERARLAAELAYVQGNGEVDVAAELDRLSLPALTAKLPMLEAAKGITVPLSVSARTSVGLSGEIGDVAAELRGGAGELAWPKFIPSPRPVRELSARVGLDRAAARLTVEDLRIAFGSEREAGPIVTGAATLAREADGLSVEGRATASGLAADDLADYWPPGLQEEGNAREWVTTNIRAGTVERAGIEVALIAPGGDLDAAEVDKLDGRLTFSGLDVHYLRPLPPVTGVDGTATFDADAFRFDVERGRLNGVRVGDTTATITGMSRSDQFLAIDLNTTGPLPDTLAPLAHPRLDLLEPLGLTPEATAGRATVTTTFDFPLIAELTMDEVEVAARARLADAAVRGLLLDRDLRDGQLELTIDKRGMDVSGPVELAGVPLEMTWRENFEDTAPFRRQVEALVPSLDDAGRARLGLDAGPFLGGPLSLRLNLRTDGDGSGRVKAAVNLKDTELALPFLDWRKPPGIEGTANLTLTLRDERLQAVESFEIATEDDGAENAMLARGQLDFAADGGTLRQLLLSRARVRKQDLREVVATPDGNGGWRVRVGGGVLDLEPFLARSEDRQAPTPEEAPGATDAGPPLALSAPRLDRLRLGEDRYVRDVSLQAERAAEGTWRVLRLDATVPGRFSRRNDTDSPLSVNYAPQADGRQAIRVEAPDAGAALRALDLYDDLVGGRLVIDGVARAPAPDSPLDAEVDLRDFRVHDAPILARILTVAVLTGIADVMRGQGLGFQSLTGEVTYHAGVLETELLHAYGTSLGITAKGKVDLPDDRIDLRGTIVPAALVNRVLGAIPLLGNILTGGEGEGLIAVTYTVTGPLDDPEVDVNPLSALAPGFLRRLFGGLLEGGAAPAERPEAIPRESPGR